MMMASSMERRFYQAFFRWNSTHCRSPAIAAVDKTNYCLRCLEIVEAPRSSSSPIALLIFNEESRGR